jgi:hypothetical protein
MLSALQASGAVGSVCSCLSLQLCEALAVIAWWDMSRAITLHYMVGIRYAVICRMGGARCRTF